LSSAAGIFSLLILFVPGDGVSWRRQRYSMPVTEIKRPAKRVPAASGPAAFGRFRPLHSIRAQPVVGAGGEAKANPVWTARPAVL